MRTHAPISFWGAVVLSLGLMCGNASGLIIYRFGGEFLPPPEEAGNQDVEFIQLPWSALDAAQGGETFQLDMDDASIKALQHDPQVNIAPTAKDRGEGPIRAENYGDVFDGDASTLWYDDGFLCAEVRFAGWCEEGYSFASTVNINLGGFYVIDRIRVISGLITPGSLAKRFRIYISPTRRSMGYVHGPFKPFFMEIIDNRDQYREIVFPPHEPVTFLQLAMHEHREPWEFAEIEIYAKGFVDKSSYVSDIIDFGASAAWGELRWSGFRDLGAKLFLHTRSGADDDPSLYWKFIGRGEDKELVTKSQYSQLKLGEKGGTTYDRDSWTLWSAPYDFADSSGAAVVSLSPRRYLQFKVDFIPWEESGSGLDFL